jgi:superfamily I DNA and/or RNA helicase
MLQQAQIVFSTLVTCGKASLIRAVPNFDCVVVDEASQAVIPETLIPFRFDPALCLLVGDPQQLPGLVHSHRLRELGYEDSLLHTMTQFQQRPYLERLATQYRMHPGICSWVSDRFYRGELTAEPSLVHRDAPISHLSAEFRQICPPSSFIDCPYMENNDRNGQIYNVRRLGS